jgi:hypothetical protein
MSNANDDQNFIGVGCQPFQMPQQSQWACYLFGNKPGGSGMAWRPNDGEVPNVVVRFFMRVCLGCTWVRDRTLFHREVNDAGVKPNKSTGRE